MATVAFGFAYLRPMEGQLLPTAWIMIELTKRFA